MNTDPNAKVILCFGDSNTWGQKPDKSGRTTVNMRWTGLLQDQLGKSYYVIEEGLGGRTIDIDDVNRPGRNGKEYFLPCVTSHSPLDIIIIMLGTNDLKTFYKRSVEDIAQSTRELVAIAKENAQTKKGKEPAIMLISPIHINDSAPRFTEFYTDYYDSHAAELSKQFAPALQKIATDTRCCFVDAATVSEAGEDGIHLSKESHKPLADLLYRKIKEL